MAKCAGGCRKEKPPVCAGAGKCKDSRFRCAGHVDVACPGKCEETAALERTLAENARDFQVGKFQRGAW